MVLLLRIVLMGMFLVQSQFALSFGKKRPPTETPPSPPPVIVDPPPPVVVVDPPPSNEPPAVSKNCVVLDAGHGDHDPGAQNASYKINEKDVALKFVLELKKLFIDNEINVKLTRETDVFIPLSGRVQFSNNSNCEYFVSIHLNSFNTQAEGFETYYGRDNSKQFATQFHNEWAPWMLSPNRGVKHANFAVIRSLEENGIMTVEEQEMVSFFHEFEMQAHPNLKSILVELYFIDNNREVERYLNEIRIVNGVFESLKKIVKP